MSELITGYKLTWADYTGFAEGHARPLKRDQKRAALPRAHVEVFRTRGEAEAAQARRQAEHGDGLVTSIVTVVPEPPKLKTALLDDLPVMTKRLTP